MKELTDALEIILNSHEDTFYMCSNQMAAGMVILIKANPACLR